MPPSPSRRPAALAVYAALAALSLLACVASASSSDSADADDPNFRCSTTEECCAVYGADSQRCLRGPCSENAIMKKFFSLSMPTEDVTFWDVVTTIYSMVPYLAVIIVLLEAVLRSRAYSRVFFVVLMILQTLITSGIMVPLIGHDCDGCARPEGTCLKSMNGMPSGHATNSIGLFSWITLETLVGVGRGHRWPLVKRGVVLLVAVFVFVPVPYSRYYLGDHTEWQLVVGSLDGVALASLYFLLLRWPRVKQAMDAVQRVVKRFLRFTIADDFYWKWEGDTKSVDSANNNSSSEPDYVVGLTAADVAITADASDDSDTVPSDEISTGGVYRKV